MESILTKQDKLNLKRTAYYLRSVGMKIGNIELLSDNDYDNIDLSDIEWNQIKTFSNNYKLQIPEVLNSILKKIVTYVISTNGTNASMEDISSSLDINWSGVDINIDTVKMDISLTTHWSYYTDGDTEDIDFENEEDLMERFKDDIIELGGDLSENGILEVMYQGSGDDGYLESLFETGQSVPQSMEDWCYAKLESFFGGWEINEGSSGHFLFDFNKNIITLLHRDTVEVSEQNTLFEENFSEEIK
jgi:hypothetical protein